MFRHPSEFVAFNADPHLPGVELYSARLLAQLSTPAQYRQQIHTRPQPDKPA